VVTGAEGPPSPCFLQVFILKGDKVLCFDTLLQVLILKVDSGTVGALAQFVALSILLGAIFLENVGGKGVRWLAGYFMGYYTIWLAPVKRIFAPVASTYLCKFEERFSFPGTV
jgi:hypothetical protein